MGGSALDYVYSRLEDPIKEIEDRLKKNGKTVQQIWDEKSEEEKQDAIEWGHDWEIPWTLEKHPSFVEQTAEDEAWENCPGVKEEKSYGCISRSLPTKYARLEWAKLRYASIKSQIEAHNNGIEREVYSPKTVAEIKKQLETIKRAKIYLERIEWLFSGDDGEDSFLERTKEDLKEAGLE